MAFAASAAHVPVSSRLSSARTRPTAAAGTLTTRMPRPISSGRTSGLAAESPQTETGMPALAAASITCAMSASTRGSAASAGPAAGSRRPRSSTCPVRSFVPMEKKSTTGANVCGGGGRGDLDHDANPWRALVQPGSGEFELPSHRRHLGQRRHHRDEDGEVSVTARAQRGRQLCSQGSRVAEQLGQASAARPGTAGSCRRRSRAAARSRADPQASRGSARAGYRAARG